MIFRDYVRITTRYLPALVYDWLSNDFAFRFFFNLYRYLFTFILKMTAKTGLAAPIWAQTSTVGVSSTSVDFPGHTAFSSSPRQSYRTQETTSEQIFQNHDLASILHSQLKHILDSNRALLTCTPYFKLARVAPGVEVRLFRAQDYRFLSCDIQDGGRNANESGTTFERNRQVRKNETVSVNL